LGENVALEQVFKAFDEEPEIFQKSWLQPLLAERLNLDGVCELVMESILCPNTSASHERLLRRQKG
jgi:hypothetical protein